MSNDAPDDQQGEGEVDGYETLDEQQRDGYSRLASPFWSLYQTLAPVVPFRQRIFKRLAVKSLENYYKISGGDALGLVAEPGQKLSVVPVKYKPPEACEEGEKAGWHAKGQDKSWEAGSEGHVVDFLGRVPIVALERDSHVEAGWLKPRVAEAIELERYDPLFATATINAIFDVNEPATGAGGQSAVADGGQEAQFQGFQIDDPGMFAGDAVIDLQSQDGHDGMRVSFRKASEWMSETTTTQEMQMQEDRGYLRGKMAAGNGPSVTKLLLICAAIILGTLAIIFIVPEFLGGSGGGGSMMPSLQLAGLMGAV